MNTDQHFDRDKMTERIGKLLRKAASVAGTAEETALLERAFALSAKYGIDETLARSGDDIDPSEIVTTTIDITGRYQLDQVVLVTSMGEALHTEVIRTKEDSITRCTMIGARRHVDRVSMLAGFLCGLMLARAARARSPQPDVVSTRSYRQSFMAGFAEEIQDRLQAAESAAVDESADAHGAHLVLASDAERAAAELRRQHPRLRTTRTNRSAAGIGEGRSAASDIDLGQSRVGGHRPALTA